MIDILTRAGAFVAIIVLGYVLKRVGVFRQEDFGVLSKLLMKVTFPCAIITSFAGRQIEPGMLLLALLAIGCGVIYMLVAVIMNLGASREQKAFDILNLPGYNIGVFALPFVSSFLGPAGVLAASIFDIGNSFICLGGAYGVASSVKAGKGFSVKRIVKALGTSVPFLCYVIMLVIRLLSLELPGPVLQLADIISGGNAFCAMLMIGVGFKLEASREQAGIVCKILGLRFGIGIAVAAAFYFLLPFAEEARMALALLAVSPMGSAIPGFTRELGEDAGVSCTIGSISIICGIVLMVAMLSLKLM